LRYRGGISGGNQRGCFAITHGASRFSGAWSGGAEQTLRKRQIRIWHAHHGGPHLVSGCWMVAASARRRRRHRRGVSRAARRRHQQAVSRRRRSGRRHRGRAALLRRLAACIGGRHQAATRAGIRRRLRRRTAVWRADSGDIAAAAGMAAYA